MKTVNLTLSLGLGLGSFTGNITGLTPGQNYYIRAYATNSAGTAYGIATSVNGHTADINSIISQQYIDELKRLGVPVYSGVTPPTVSGIYNVSPYALKGSNISTDNIGNVYDDMIIQFSQQDLSKLTIQIDYVQSSLSSTRTGSFIVGSGYNFTVFSRTVTTKPYGTSIMVEIFSGTLDTNSLKDYSDGFIMIDNGGTSTLLTGQGRVFWDSDGVSEKVSFLKSAHIPGSLPKKDD
jgi:hypothetical protein